MGALTLWTDSSSWPQPPITAVSCETRLVRLFAFFGVFPHKKDKICMKGLNGELWRHNAVGTRCSGTGAARGNTRVWLGLVRLLFLQPVLCARFQSKNGWCHTHNCRLRSRNSPRMLESDWGHGQKSHCWIRIYLGIGYIDFLTSNTCATENCHQHSLLSMNKVMLRLV